MLIKAAIVSILTLFLNSWISLLIAPLVFLALVPTCIEISESMVD